MSSGDKYKDLIILSRMIDWQYQLADYTEAALKNILKSVKLAQNELLFELGTRDVAVLNELNNLTFGIQAKLTNDVLQAASIAGETAYQEYGSIMSFNGRLNETVGFNNVALSAAQLNSMILETPVGGQLLNEWVTGSFQTHLVDDMKVAIGAGMLRGEGISKLIDRIPEAMGMVERDMITLTRTYVSDINNRAAKATYDANADIITHEIWNSTLESNTCMRCSVLDGREYPLKEDHIRPPIHHKCRCFMLPKTLSYKELGLNIDELAAVARPYSIRAAATEAGGSPILGAGTFNGDFEKFQKAMGKDFQVNLFGPNRVRLLNEKKIKWDDMVDKNGNIRLLKKDSNGDYVGLI